MLINADFKQLEILGAFYLSKDPVGYEELLTGIDLHSENQKAFGLPTRLIAKTFKFRLIYGGSAYSYANDPDFMGVSDKEKYWQKVIDKYYDKYKGLKQWHDDIVEEVMYTGQLTIPTGRVFKFVPEIRRGEPKWPRTTILNYPVQGFGADLVMLARVMLAKRLRREYPTVLLVSTIHDSIILDCPDELVEAVCRLIFEVWEELPKTFEQVFKVPMDLPTKVEILYGRNLKDMKEFHAEASGV